MLRMSSRMRIAARRTGIVVSQNSPSHYYHHHHHQQARRHLQWVPLAYRGAMPIQREQQQHDRHQEDDRSKYDRRNNNRRSNNHSPKQRPRTFREKMRSMHRPDHRPATGGGGGRDGDRWEHVAVDNTRNRQTPDSSGVDTKRNAQRLETMHENLLGLQTDITRLAKEYRGAFFVDSSPSDGDGGFTTTATATSITSVVDSSPLLLPNTTRRIIHIQYQDENEQKKAALRTMTRQLQTTFSDIHADAVLVEWKHILATEDSFRGLCRALQDCINTAATAATNNTCRWNDELVNLAEAALAALVKLRSDRSLLVDSTKTWTMDKNTSTAHYHHRGDDVSTHQGMDVPTTFLERLVSIIGGGGTTGGTTTASPGNEQGDISFTNRAQGHQKQQEVTDDGSPATTMMMAHQDDALGVSQKLFASVMNAVVLQADARAAGSSSSSQAPEHPQQLPDLLDRTVYETASRRMIALLDIMPSTWIPDAEVVKQVLEMLCNAGSLESARACHMIFTRHPDNHRRLRFSLVLQAYLEATMHEQQKQQQPSNENDNDEVGYNNNNNILITVVREAFSALNNEWNSNLPQHRVERIVHASIVFRCMCVALRRGAHIRYVDAELLVKRIIGKEAYVALQQELYPNDDDDNVSGDITSTDDGEPVASAGGGGGGGVDGEANALILPLVNCLAQAYSIGPSPNFEKARCLLSYIMKHDTKQGLRFMQFFPTVDTINAVILSHVLEYEDKKKPNKGDEQAVAADIVKTLDYADSLLDYLLSRETSFWPNGDTFSALFRLLVATKPQDMGPRAENILSKMEIRRAFSPVDNDTDENNATKISLSTYHRVLRCWLEASKEAIGAETAENYNNNSSSSMTCCAQRALRILERLEIQSIPFLMNDREIQISSYSTLLYDLELRPTRQTYRLVLQISLHAMNRDKEALNVAFAVYDKLAKRNMVPPGGGGSDFDVLLHCIDKLPVNSDERKAAQARLQSILDGKNSSDGVFIEAA